MSYEKGKRGAEVIDVDMDEREEDEWRNKERI